MHAKSKALALLVPVLLLAPKVSAAQVTYWFTGHVTSISNPSNALPFEVAVGTPFAARLSYETTLVGYSNVATYPGGDIGFYYFTNTAGFSLIFQIAGHTITNSARVGGYSGSVGIYDQYNNEDSYWSDVGNLTVDGAPFLSDPLFSGISIYLSDRSKTVFNSTALPTNAPPLSSFPDHRDLTWGAYVDDGIPTRLFSISGVFTEVSLTEKVILNWHPVAANSLKLSWPASVSGFTLESLSNLASTNWQSVSNPVIDIGMEHTVTVSDPAPFYRLKK